MGKGDKKSKRGKIARGTFGVRRPRKKTKTYKAEEVKPKKKTAAKPKAAVKPKPAAKKKAAPKKADKK